MAELHTTFFHNEILGVLPAAEADLLRAKIERARVVVAGAARDAADAALLMEIIGLLVTQDDNPTTRPSEAWGFRA